MAQQYIFTDGPELNLLLKGKTRRESYLLGAADVRRISFSVADSELLFGLIKKKVRRITIIGKGIGTVEFDEPRHKAFFETYITDLRAYCKANRVTFYDFDQQARETK